MGFDVVREVLEAVEREGDGAVRRYSEQFDGVAPQQLTFGSEEMQKGLDRIDAAICDSLLEAAAQITEAHEAQLQSGISFERCGVRIDECVHPVGAVAAYVPGGRYRYPSTVLMTVIPARLAGVRDVAVCTPPDETGAVPDIILAAAAIAGATRVHPVGGVQAIGAVTFGTDSIASVDLIVGPGNSYVNEAKRQVFGRVGIDGLAGPSEVAIIAGADADLAAVRAGIAAQLEHGPDSFATLIALDAAVLSADEFGDRCTLMSAADDETAVRMVNEVASEHVELYGARAEALADRVTTAGAVFVGMPAVVGDYIAGTNHTLPTGRSGRWANGLRVEMFQRRVPVVRTLPRASLIEAGITLAETEGMSAHAAALRRLS